MQKNKQANVSILEAKVDAYATQYQVLCNTISIPNVLLDRGDVNIMIIYIIIYISVKN